MNNVTEYERHLLVKTVKQMVGQVMAKTWNKFCLLKVVTVTFIVIVFSITQRFNGFDLHVSHLVTTFFCKYQEISKQLKTLPDSVTRSCDVIFTIKTTEKLHQSRLELVLKTWSKLVEKQAFFITDRQDPVYDERTKKRLHATNCGSQHYHGDLCCKTDKEYALVKPQMDEYKWWCHFDDDVYVNVRNLLDVLGKHNPSDPVYIGKKSMQYMKKNYKGKAVKFVFATGSGYCISRSLFKMMGKWIGDEMFLQFCSETRLTDDCAMGFLITYILNVPLTEYTTFHMHIENLAGVKDLKNQVTLSYYFGRNRKNVVTIPADQAAFNETVDPTRMLSLHCLNIPDDDICPHR